MASAYTWQVMPRNGGGDAGGGGEGDAGPCGGWLSGVIGVGGVIGGDGMGGADGGGVTSASRKPVSIESVSEPPQPPAEMLNSTGVPCGMLTATHRESLHNV